MWVCRWEDVAATPCCNDVNNSTVTTTKRSFLLFLNLNLRIASISFQSCLSLSLPLSAFLGKLWVSSCSFSMLLSTLLDSCAYSDRRWWSSLSSMAIMVVCCWAIQPMNWSSLLWSSFFPSQTIFSFPSSISSFLEYLGLDSIDCPSWYSPIFDRAGTLFVLF